MGDSKSTAQLDNVIRSGSRRLREFDPKAFSWEEWEIFFDAYVAGEKITDETEKRDLLITSMADQPFKTLVAICKPKKPTNCSYNELLEKLRSNYARVTLLRLNRSNFSVNVKRRHKQLRISPTTYGTKQRGVHFRLSIMNKP